MIRYASNLDEYQQCLTNLRHPMNKLPEEWSASFFLESNDNNLDLPLHVVTLKSIRPTFRPTTEKYRTMLQGLQKYRIRRYANRRVWPPGCNASGVNGRRPKASRPFGSWYRQFSPDMTTDVDRSAGRMKWLRPFTFGQFFALAYRLLRKATNV